MILHRSPFFFFDHTLPFVSSSSFSSLQEIDRQIAKKKAGVHREFKLLLLGTGESGKSALLFAREHAPQHSLTLTLIGMRAFFGGEVLTGYPPQTDTLF